MRPRLLILPALGTLLTTALAVAIRERTGLDTHRFLLWNLLLAWLPLAAALALYWQRRRPEALLLLGVFWLAFLPNAPYLVTDLVHYGQLNPAIPAWLDLAALLAAAATGMALFLLALFYVHQALRERLGGWSWLPLAATLPLVSFGVYLGRGPRFNSWDVIERPSYLVALALDRLRAPAEHPHMLVGVTVCSLGLALSYLVCYGLLARGARKN